MSSEDLFSARLKNFPPHIRKLVHESMVNEFKRKQMAKGVPEEFSEANIQTLGRMASVGKKSFFNVLAKKRGPHALPPVVEEEILEYLGVKRGQSPKQIVKTVKNIRKRANENKKRAEREQQLKEQWAPIVELYEEVEKNQKQKSNKSTRRKQVQKSRLRRGKTSKLSKSNYENKKTRNNRNNNNNFNFEYESNNN
jgi:hypothetical protein